MKIYTKTGDLGETSTYAGKRVSKSSLKVRVNGQVDELNSTIGVLSALLSYGNIKEKLTRVQADLMELGADISLGIISKKNEKFFRINETHVVVIESEIDLWEKEITPLKNFILPGGSIEGANAHLVRTVCRRAERELVALALIEKVNPQALKYLNRLSDWFFVLARYLNKIKHAPETKFISSRKSSI